jgi:hypothetical protein
LNVIETYGDGSHLVETLVILSPVVPDITVHVDVIVAGVTFDDGTIHKELTPEDFDELGQHKLRFLMPADVQTATCHVLNVWQGSEFVGSY